MKLFDKPTSIYCLAYCSYISSLEPLIGDSMTSSPLIVFVGYLFDDDLLVNAVVLNLD